MICRSCKKSIPDGSEKCPLCGAPTASAGVSSDTQVFGAVAPEKKPLYKAADVDPERPVRRIDEERPQTSKPRRAPALTAALWILGVAAAAALIFGGARLLFRGDDKGSKLPDASDADTPDPDAQTPSDGQNTDEAGKDPDQPNDPDAKTPPEPKPVYDIRGTWRWESEADGYRNTYWVFSTAGKLDIYLVGDEYAFEWPTQYSYDKDSYVLGLTDAAMGLAWLDEDTFASGSGKAYRVDTSEIPDNAVNVRELEAPQDDEEEDPYLLPESASRYLKQADLEGMDKKQLTLARNEIFARHGRLFSTTEIQEYFDQQSWYTGYIKPANFDSSVLNDYERYNVTFISRYEDSL